MSQVEADVDEEECKKCIKEAKLNSHNTNDCYSCHQARRKPAVHAVSLNYP